mgnify:FL=1
MTTFTITLPKKEKARLAHIASRYGLSLVELSRHVLTTLSDTIPLEYINEYENPISLKQSIRRGYRDMKVGRVHDTL